MADLPEQGQFGDYDAWQGRAALDRDGERLGDIREIYLDQDTKVPEWVLVDIEGAGARFVPLADASVEGDRVRVAHARAAVEAAPDLGTQTRIDQDDERRLYAHYGVPYSEAESDTGLPATTDEAASGEPAAAEAAPEPTPEPATPEPAAAEPEPVAAEPEPVAEPTREPVAGAPEPAAPAAATATAAPPRPQPFTAGNGASAPERSRPAAASGSQRALRMAGVAGAAAVVALLILRRIRG